MPDHLLPVALVLRHELAEDETAGGAKVAGVRHAKPAPRCRQLGVDLDAPVLRHEVQRLLVHGAGHDLPAALPVETGALHVPGEGVERSVRGLGIGLEPLLEEAGDGGLGGSHRAVEQDDALLRPVALGGALEDVDELHEGDVEPVDGVLAAELGVGEEVVADEPLLVVDVLGLPVAQDHVVDALEGGPRHLRVLTNDPEVVLERPLPVLLRVALAVLHRGDASHPARLGHAGSLRRRGDAAPRSSITLSVAPRHGQGQAGAGHRSKGG